MAVVSLLTSMAHGRWIKYLMLAVSKMGELRGVSWKKKEEISNKTALHCLEGAIWVLLLEVSRRFWQVMS